MVLFTLKFEIDALVHTWEFTVSLKISYELKRTE